jgi:hypothetical protein
MNDTKSSLTKFKAANDVIVQDEFFEFDTEHYENKVLAERPWRKE